MPPLRGVLWRETLRRMRAHDLLSTKPRVRGLVLCHEIEIAKQNKEVMLGIPPATPSISDDGRRDLAGLGVVQAVVVDVVDEEGVVRILDQYTLCSS